MGFLKSLFSGGSDDEPLASQREDVTRLPMYQMGLMQYQEGRDEIEGAFGNFGYEPTNPIPVNGPVGETVYINRLRGKSGVGFMYHRIGSVQSPPANHPLDHFELVALDASERHELFFDLYYFHRSTQVPEGLSMLPWSRMDKQFRMMCKLNAFGTNSHVDDFPFGLPERIQASRELNSISPGIGRAMADRVRDALKRHEGKWPRAKS